MNRKHLISGCILFVLLLSAFAAAAERKAPQIVGANSYRPKPEEVQIQPLTFGEAEKVLSGLLKEKLGAYADDCEATDYAWTSEGLKSPQVQVTLTGGVYDVTVILARTPFDMPSGSGSVSQFTNRVRERDVIEVRGIVQRASGIDLPRGVQVGANLETLLSAYGIAEISPEGLIYDNDLLFADEGSEDSDFGEHPEQYAVIREKDGATVVEFTAFDEAGDHACTVSYCFSGEKIASVKVEKK